MLRHIYLLTVMTVVLVGMNRHSNAAGVAETERMQAAADYVQQARVPAVTSHTGGKLLRKNQIRALHKRAVYVTVDPETGERKVVRRHRKIERDAIRGVEERLREDELQLRSTARALAEVLMRTGPGLEASPEVARSVQASENHWRTIADEYGLLDSRAVDELLGGSGTNRNRAHQLAKEGKIIGVKRGRGIVYPGFEFHNGEVRPVIALVAALGRGNKWSDSHLLLWLASPNGYLEGRVPAQMLDQPDKVIRAARQDLAERW